jgi:hypothetical protein
MELNEREIRDLQYLRRELSWSEQDGKDVMRSIRESAEGAWFYVVLAATRRAGYRFRSKTAAPQVQAWCLLEGLPDPFEPGADRAKILAALDARRKP